MFSPREVISRTCCFSSAGDYLRACFLVASFHAESFFVVTLHAIPFGGTRDHWIVCVCF